VVVGEVDRKGAQGVGHPASCGRLEAEALGVDQGNNGHGLAAVGEIDTADAAVILDEDAEEVLVGDSLRVAGSLHTSHHERVLFRDHLLHALLFLELSNLVLDLVQLEVQVRGPIRDASVGAFNCLVDKAMAVDVRVVSDTLGQDLLHIERNAMCVQLAPFVVHADLTFGDFVGQEHVLVKDGGHGGLSLVNAAPGLDVASLGLGFTDDHVDGLLTDDEHLLVLHVVMLVVAVEGGLDVVLDLGLRLLTRVLVLKVERRRDALGQSSLELNLVNTRLQHATLDVKDTVLVLKELFGMLHFLVSLDSACLVSVALSLVPEADE